MRSFLRVRARAFELLRFLAALEHVLSRPD